MNFLNVSNDVALKEINLASMYFEHAIKTSEDVETISYFSESEDGDGGFIEGFKQFVKNIVEELKEYYQKIRDATSKKVLSLKMKLKAKKIESDMVKNFNIIVKVPHYSDFKKIKKLAKEACKVEKERMLKCFELGRKGNIEGINTINAHYAKKTKDIMNKIYETESDAKIKLRKEDLKARQFDDALNDLNMFLNAAIADMSNMVEKYGMEINKIDKIPDPKSEKIEKVKGTVEKAMKSARDSGKSSITCLAGVAKVSLKLVAGTAVSMLSVIESLSVIDKGRQAYYNRKMKNR